MFMFFLLYKLSIIIRDLNMFINAFLEGSRGYEGVDFFGDEMCMSVCEEPCVLYERRRGGLFTCMPHLSTGL